MKQTSGFVSIGAGNVATHLVRHLCKSGFRLLQVYSRTPVSAQSLASECNAGFTVSVSEISKDADFYIVSLPDKILPGFLEEFTICDQLVVHTAGSHGMEVFGQKYKHCGVLYPLHTFTKNVETDLSDIPFLIEANNTNTLAVIRDLASKISVRVISCDAETRRWVHLAAIFACNFTNHMYAASNQILAKKNLDPSILNSVIEETFRKSRRMDPVLAQTGPAERNDSNIIDKHIKMLEDQPLLQKIYIFTSRSIQEAKSSGQKNQVNE